MSCVIIDKLPFCRTHDRSCGQKQIYRRESGRSFFEYSVPQAVISLKQGIGRLIRSQTDRGVIAILTRGFELNVWARILNSLPNANNTDLDDVADMLS